MIDYRFENSRCRRGSALVIVLFVVMFVTVMGLGFISRGDMELACSENVQLREQMDLLAESGIAHAAGLLVNPQDVSTGSDDYWTGDTGLQLEAGDDYYDVNVTRHTSGWTAKCSYDIQCRAYRSSGAEIKGQSQLRATLRMDPCIGLWMGGGDILGAAVTVNGDMYHGGASLLHDGVVRGDMLLAGDVNGVGLGSCEGQVKSYEASVPGTFPAITTSDFSSSYYIDNQSYSVYTWFLPDLTNTSYKYSDSNPAGVFYHNGDFELAGLAMIEGMVVVDGNLRISGTYNTVTAVDNFPAMVVSGDLVLSDSAELTVEGLAIVHGSVVVEGGASNVVVNVVGSLYVGGGIEGAVAGSGMIAVSVEPFLGAIETWPAAQTPYRWSPVAGAFIKKIERY